MKRIVLIVVLSSLTLAGCNLRDNQPTSEMEQQENYEKSNDRDERDKEMRAGRRNYYNN